MNGSQNSDRVLSDPYIVASDEAGHAILAHILGREIECIQLTLNVRGTYNGITIYRQPCLPPHIDPDVPYEKIKIHIQQLDREIPPANHTIVKRGRNSKATVERTVPRGAKSCATDFKFASM